MRDIKQVSFAMFEFIARYKRFYELLRGCFAIQGLTFSISSLIYCTSLQYSIAIAYRICYNKSREFKMGGGENNEY